MAEKPVSLDCDVLFGTWPPRAQLPMDIDHVRALLAKSDIRGALACSARGAWFDDVEGNTETLSTLATVDEFEPVATVNLRNALRAEAELDRAVSAGARAVRMFANQGAAPNFPGYVHVVSEAVKRDLVLLVEGDVRSSWQAFAGRGAKVVFLDVHAYHVADFVLVARAEPTFVASTRLLNAPDSIERVVGEVGAQHLAYGSRAPLHSISPSLLRLRNARISEADWSAAAGGTLQALLSRSEA